MQKEGTRLPADMEKIADALERGAQMDDDVVDAYLGMTREALNVEQSNGTHLRNMDRLAVQMSAPLDALDRMYEKYPILAARRGFNEV